VCVDGLAEPTNPGVGTFGYVIYQEGRKIAEAGEFVAENVTNNYAEYSGLVAALTTLKKKGATRDSVTVKSDSQLLVNQMKGLWKGTGGGYGGKYKEALDLSRFFRNITYEWVPREQNEEADLLSRIAYEGYLKSKREHAGKSPRED
jgi:ribonuclease HI